MPVTEISEMWAWVMVDPKDDVEGVIGEYIPDMGTFMPFVGADAKRIDSLEEKARNIAHAAGRDVTLKRFTTMTVVKVIKGTH